MSKLLVDRLKRMGACRDAIRHFSQTRKLSRQLWDGTTNSRWLLWYAAMVGVPEFYFDALGVDRNSVLNSPSSMSIEIGPYSVRSHIPYKAVVEAREKWEAKNERPKTNRSNKPKRQKAKYRTK